MINVSKIYWVQSLVKIAKGETYTLLKTPILYQLRNILCNTIVYILCNWKQRN